MVLSLNVVILGKELLDLIREIIGAQPGLGGSHVVHPRGYPHIGQGITCDNGVVYELEERGFHRRGHLVVERRRRIAECLPVGQHVISSERIRSKVTNETQRSDGLSIVDQTVCCRVQELGLPSGIESCQVRNEAGNLSGF